MDEAGHGRIRIHVRGIVQGVGFRPHVYRLARAHGLVGWVSNGRRGVEIEVEGPAAARDRFLAALVADPPPLARIEAADAEPIPPEGGAEFVIRPSTDEPTVEVAPVTPDAAICADCLRELFDRADRRYLYPFINCTRCGPRFTIVRGVPYDRPRTTMAGFPMCDACRAEYEDPADRRFHAQPIACPTCGPRLALHGPDGRPMETPDPLREAKRLLEAGRIVAVKGLGGYHLACNARDAASCRALRGRKWREDKPFAVMARDLVAARRIGVTGPEAEALLRSPASPIVIVPKVAGYDLADAVAPATHAVGVMLPYTPLHHLLFHESAFDVLVMTSGNRADEPIAYTEEDAFARLAGIADAYLVHDRPIHMRCDDSVVRCDAGVVRKTLHGVTVIRRARGYAPEAIRLVEPLCRPILACGGQLKHTFCIGVGERAYLSHHIGDLDNEATWKAFVEGVDHYRRLFEIDPAAIAHDLHPDYLSTRYAEEHAQRRVAEGGEGAEATAPAPSPQMENVGILPTFPIQHHWAHVAACLADSGRTETVLGLAFDGTGYGDDGTIWGGEWLAADFGAYRRVARLRPLVLPGGEAAIRQPWRLAAYVLDAVLGRDDWHAWNLPLGRWFDPGAWALLSQAIARRAQDGARGVNIPETSAMGRLFDAVAALAGLRGAINYEAQAAIEFEQMADPTADGAYPFPFAAAGDMMELDWRPAISDIVGDLRRGEAAGAVSMRFHRGLAAGVVALTKELATATGLRTAALSGGVFQNELFAGLVIDGLRARGIEVLTHRQVPPNDGGLALGQLVIANRLLAAHHDA